MPAMRIVQLLHLLLAASGAPWLEPNVASRFARSNTTATDANTGTGTPRLYWCPSNHQLRGIDPSAPMLDSTGVWHVYGTGGGWSHYTSTNLLNWFQFPEGTGFDVGTGSTSPVVPARETRVHSKDSHEKNAVAVRVVGNAPGGTAAAHATGVKWLAFYPNTSVPFPCCDIDVATSAAPNQTDWVRHGVAIKRPASLSTHQGFRDPHRPVCMAGSWWMGVGSGTGPEGATLPAGRVHWFKATSSARTAWEDAGIFFQVCGTNVLFVYM